MPTFALTDVMDGKIFETQRNLPTKDGNSDSSQLKLKVILLNLGGQVPGRADLRLSLWHKYSQYNKQAYS